MTDYQLKNFRKQPFNSDFNLYEIESHVFLCEFRNDFLARYDSYWMGNSQSPSPRIFLLFRFPFDAVITTSPRVCDALILFTVSNPNSSTIVDLFFSSPQSVTKFVSEIIHRRYLSEGGTEP